MSFDGIVTRACVRELNDSILGARVDKIYQPGPEDISIYFKSGRERRVLFITTKSSAASLRLIDRTTENPEDPYPFSMLLRKHLQGSKLIGISQLGAERVVEMLFERLNELGLMVQKRLIVEIMGKHSNIVLIDDSDYKILGSVKGVPSGINRVREVLPGRFYEYPPTQNKIDFDKVKESDLEGPLAGKDILSKVCGISPAIAEELAKLPGGSDRKAFLDAAIKSIGDLSYTPRVYMDKNDVPREFHIVPLSEFEGLKELSFGDLSKAADYYFEHKESTSTMAGKRNELLRPVKAALEKAELKKKRLSEDLLSSENSGKYKLYGELLTANLGMIRQGMNEIELLNYYDNKKVVIKLDPRWTPSKNAQNYYRKFNKAKTAVVEKKSQLAYCQENIDYLASVLSFIENSGSVAELEALKEELVSTGFIRSASRKKNKPKKLKADPRRYETSDGFTVLVGRNNRENDVLTLEMAGKNDYWFHTKDIPGSHVIVRSEGSELTETAIREAASLAAFYSKARSSANVPVDYTRARYVKKPAGAKPGMVIFTHNRTVYADPKKP